MKKTENILEQLIITPNSNFNPFKKGTIDYNFYEAQKEEIIRRLIADVKFYLYNKNIDSIPSENLYHRSTDFLNLLEKELMIYDYSNKDEINQFYYLKHYSSNSYIKDMDI